MATTSPANSKTPRPVPGATPSPPDVPSAHLTDLQQVLERDIPMCAQMAMQVTDCSDRRLSVSMPLELNHNHQQTAFAGSLNALCTIVGWGTMYLLLRRLETTGNIVIRRSSIKYHRPVATTHVTARCQPVDPLAQQHFAEMYAEKGQAKLDLAVEIAGEGRSAVTFTGSYVVTREDCQIGVFAII
ncbi:YiiD C-terminal domain-containing protein [Aeoliella sp.]|uniref:YiiD C-terminal domain-containing protein n=1 Tax=Aeoliella sp. TaxID=2795800 RepID=UPI003CCB92BC